MFVEVDDGSYINVDNIIRISRPINKTRRIECTSNEKYFITEDTFNILKPILDIRSKDTNKTKLEKLEIGKSNKQN